MLAATLINPMIPVLKPNDSVGTALDWMDEFGVKQLVIADSGVYQGIVSEDILFDITDISEQLSKVIIQHKDIFATEDQHPYELLRLVNQVKHHAHAWLYNTFVLLFHPYPFLPVW